MSSTKIVILGYIKVFLNMYVDLHALHAKNRKFFALLDKFKHLSAECQSACTSSLGAIILHGPHHVA